MLKSATISNFKSLSGFEQNTKIFFSIYSESDGEKITYYFQFKLEKFFENFHFFTFRIDLADKITSPINDLTKLSILLGVTIINKVCGINHETE